MEHRIGRLVSLYNSEWLIVRNYDEFVLAIELDIDSITHVSFDHDLADSHYTTEITNDIYGEPRYDYRDLEKTGYNCAKWMKEYYRDKDKSLPILFVHSMNPVGTQNIINLFKDEKEAKN